MESANRDLKNKKPEIKFKGGRPDCPTSPNDPAEHEFPAPTMSRKEMMDWFANITFGFGMDEEQVR